MKPIYDQSTRHELELLLADYEAAFDVLPTIHPVDGLPVASVVGGEILTWAHGHAAIQPSLRLVGDSGSRVPVIELRFRWREHGFRSTFVLDTSPARVIRVGQVWQHAAYTGPGQTRHFITLNEVRDEVRIRLEVLTPRFACAPLREDDGTFRQDVHEYLIPPAATAIVGAGTVRYLAGPEIVIAADTPLVLPRLDEQFNYVYTAGGCYARFYGTAPARVMVGNAWLPTPLAN